MIQVLQMLQEKIIPTRVWAGKSRAHFSGGVLHMAAVIGLKKSECTLLVVVKSSL